MRISDWSSDVCSSDLLTAFENRRDVGIHPIVIAVFRAVLDDSHPRFALLERPPHMGEHGRRYIGVTNDILRRADEVPLVETAYIDESIVAVGDDASCIGSRDKPLLRYEDHPALRTAVVVSHQWRSFDLIQRHRPH